MKKTIKKNIAGLMLIAGFVLVVSSCSKQQNTGNGYQGNANVSTSLLDGNAVVFPSLCTGTIPDILNVPEGNRLALQTFAKGLQIYEVQRSAADPTRFTWVNIAPLATLYLNANFTNEVIHHFAGPTWEFLKGTEKGEKVVAKKVQGITQDTTAIQWLLLKADSTLSTPGNKVTFVQRICTAGGLAPAIVPDEAHLGLLDSIPYTASYLFYVKK